MTGLQKGDEITVPSEQLSEVVKRIHQQRFFSNVALYVDSLSANKDTCTLVLDLKERPRVSRWSFKGIKKSEQTDITERVKLRRGGELSDYVVKSTTPGCEGNTADQAPLGVGRLVISFSGPEGAEAAHPESYAFFMSLKEGDVVTPSHYWEALATASGETSFSFTMATSGSKGPKAPTKGAINVVNGRGTIAMGDGASYATDIIAVATKDSSKVAAQTIGGGLNYCSSILVEKTETGKWKVIGVDANPVDGWCSLDGEKLGEGRILIAIHAGVADKDSAAFFLGTAQIGQEYYLVGEIPAEDITSFGDGGTTLSGVYFTTVEPGTEVEEETGSDAGTGSDEGTESDEEIKNTGDNFVPMFVVLFAGLAMVTVATISKRRTV
jgi:hypothetical protein